MKLQKYFGYTIVNNILKSQKLWIILLGFTGLAPHDHHLSPYIFFKHTAKFNNYAFANRPRTDSDFFANANFYLRNVLRFVGKHSILQITPEEESLGLKSGLWGARSNFWFISAISFLSATVSFCSVCIRYGYLFKCATITFQPVDMLKFKDWLRRRSDRFGLRSTDSCTISTNLLCTSPGSTRMAETVRGFVIKVNRSPIRLKLTDPVFDNCFMKFSIDFEKCMKLLWNLLDWATLIIIFLTEDTVMELPIWYRFLSNPFSWHVSKF